MDAPNFHCRIWNTERQAYGSPFVVCGQHLQDIRRNLQANFAPCWIEQIAQTDRPCEDCEREDEPPESQGFQKLKPPD